MLAAPTGQEGQQLIHDLFEWIKARRRDPEVEIAAVEAEIAEAAAEVFAAMPGGYTSTEIDLQAEQPTTKTLGDRAYGVLFGGLETVVAISEKIDSHSDDPPFTRRDKITFTAATVFGQIMHRVGLDLKEDVQ